MQRVVNRILIKSLSEGDVGRKSIPAPKWPTFYPKPGFSLNGFNMSVPRVDIALFRVLSSLPNRAHQITSRMTYLWATICCDFFLCFLLLFLFPNKWILLAENNLKFFRICWYSFITMDREIYSKIQLSSCIHIWNDFISLCILWVW